MADDSGRSQPRGRRGVLARLFQTRLTDKPFRLARLGAGSLSWPFSSSVREDPTPEFSHSLDGLQTVSRTVSVQLRIQSVSATPNL